MADFSSPIDQLRSQIARQQLADQISEMLVEERRKKAQTDPLREQIAEMLAEQAAREQEHKEFLAQPVFDVYPPREEVPESEGYPQGGISRNVSEALTAAEALKQLEEQVYPMSTDYKKDPRGMAEKLRNSREPQVGHLEWFNSLFRDDESTAAEAVEKAAQPKGRDFADDIVDALVPSHAPGGNLVENESGWSDWVEPEVQIIQSVLDANQGDFSAGFGEDWEGGTGGSFSQVEETDELIARREDMLDWLAMQPGRDAASILSDPAMARHYKNPAAVAQVLQQQAQSNMVERHRESAIQMMEAAVGKSGKMTPTSAAMISQSTGVEVPKGMVGYDWADVEDHIKKTANDLQSDIMRTFLVPNPMDPNAKGIPADVQLARRAALRKVNEVVNKYRALAASRKVDPTDLITNMNNEMAAIAAQSNVELSILKPKQLAWGNPNESAASKTAGEDEDELVFEKIGK